MARYTVNDRKYPNALKPLVFPFDLTDGDGKVIPYRNVEFWDSVSGEVVAALHDETSGKILYKTDDLGRSEKAETVVQIFFHKPPLTAVVPKTADANGTSPAVTVGVP